MTVTPIRPDVPKAGTGFRIHHTRPATTGVEFTEWCIEEQMSAAVDTGDDTGFAALIAFNPAMDLALVDAVDRLYGLAQQAAHGELVGDWQERQQAAGEYRDDLHSLAVLLRGGAR